MTAIVPEFLCYRIADKGPAVPKTQNNKGWLHVKLENMVAEDKQAEID